ncbi:mannose-1-phosphate guanylyltransferase [Clostridium cellulovorans]|uniref:mannose-1-phosphate guanylyltransferase n=1 Tax=Clostridium cellulovorans (strain ATCC 35296 / DSM 3052 / OCM 3 / 743B) TaxID=573061 RepID=D9SVC4_CLOC7|nr:mannose-1-phosphate guanylyltransferase [Clostridium cellulovorans]ADL51048.1 Mannose-1-phosphate guanylyltransferase [Clostridium cellulovorans 743B]
MLYALILAGGKGTRLYPLSREENPKQFLEIINDKSFLRNTVDRILKLIPKENIYVVTNEAYKEKIYSNLKELPKENIFIEPSNKETATCIGLSAVKLLKKDKEAVMLVLPSDHYIDKEDEFLETVKQGVNIAERKRGLVTIGINPTRPETGYGYIEMGQRVPSAIPSYKVNRFVEKPNLEVAQDFLAKGTYLWNSGMFIWKADVFLREMEKYLPKMYKALMEIYQVAGTEAEDETIEIQYNVIDGISVDFGIMQKTRKAYVVKSEFGWDDIGSFKALSRFLKDEQGNKAQGNTFLYSCENCSVFGEKKLIIGFGISDLVIVDSGDVILIMDKNKDQEIKQLVKGIKDKEGLNNYL